MPPRLPPGRRAELKAEAYKLSVEDNLSNRSIASALGIDPKTVAALLREAAEEVRQDSAIIYQRTLHARLKVLKDLDKTLESENVSPHARSQLAHAVNSTLDSIDLLAGTRQPSKVAVAARVSGTAGGYGGMEATIRDRVSRLSDNELSFFRMVLDKLDCPEAELAGYPDVVEEIIRWDKEGRLEELGE